MRLSCLSVHREPRQCFSLRCAIQLELFNRSKYRDGSAPGDDVPLVVPDVVYGVFDGATDPLGTVINGTAAGRLAAMTVAVEMATIARDPRRRRASGAEIIAQLSSALKCCTDPLGLHVPPSTTIAVALDCGETWRFLLLGDSGLRLNGTEIYHRHKTIDHVSTVARVALFNIFKSQNDDLDAVEAMSRRGIFLGLRTAVCDGVLSLSRADAIIDEAIAATKLQTEADTVRRFLMGGIQTQFEFGNTSDSLLGFETMNGTQITGRELQDFERPKTDVTHVELYTDGYPSTPADVSVAAWEENFQAAERSDFHKIGQFATVKGSTSTEFYDDRSVLILS